VPHLCLQEELERNRCRPRSIEVWQRGVDTDVFNPRHKSAAMRARMSDGHPDSPLLVYVGRLGAEKNTEALKDILLQVGAEKDPSLYVLLDCVSRLMWCGWAGQHTLSWQRLRAPAHALACSLSRESEVWTALCKRPWSV
jgi:glycosyltransferase involved in cell wall biosynthesis